MPFLYQCCICKQPMPHASDPANPLDPCSLVLVSNINLDRRKQKEQEFPCHFECFRRLVSDDSLMFIMEPDYSTIGEMEDEQASQGSGRSPRSGMGEL
jgi:hypothetical protein